MVGTTRTAQEAETNGVLNRDTPPKGPRPTAKGKDRIQRGKAFMKDWPLPKMETCMKGLKEGKKKTVLLACGKRVQEDQHDSDGDARVAGYGARPACQGEG